MTNYRWKAETELWMSDPDYWVWQFQDRTGIWITLRRQHPPYAAATFNYRLVPRPWLEEPGKWEVWARLRMREAVFIHAMDPPKWDHRNCVYELRPRKRTYQARVEIPAPETEEPQQGAMYYIPDMMCEYADIQWDGGAWDRTHLERGLVYLTPENATARAEAMRKIERCAG